MTARAPAAAPYLNTPARLLRVLWLWARLGMVYYAIEGAYRFVTGDGMAHFLMLPVGGLCALAVGSINQFKRFYSMPVPLQCVIGTALTLLIEFAAGCILNLWLGMGIWDYSALPGNILGQICPLFAAAWYCLMPYAIWLEDRERLREWGEGEKYSLLKIYLEAFGLLKWTAKRLRRWLIRRHARDRDRRNKIM